MNVHEISFVMNYERMDDKAFMEEITTTSPHTIHSLDMMWNGILLQLNFYISLFLFYFFHLTSKSTSIQKNQLWVWKKNYDDMKATTQKSLPFVQGWSKSLFNGDQK